MCSLKEKIMFKKITTDAILPIRATDYSAGYDIFSNEEITIEPHLYNAVSTGLSVELPNTMEAQIRPRSGLAIKHGITVLNAPGTIDADYRGEIKILLINHSNQAFHINKGDRIAQMIFAYVSNIEIIEVDCLTDTYRGVNGFGSTGISKI